MPNRFLARLIDRAKAPFVKVKSHRDSVICGSYPSDEDASSDKRVVGGAQKGTWRGMSTSAASS